MNHGTRLHSGDRPGGLVRAIHWGHDDQLECYWANLWRDDDRFDAPRIAISCSHLVPTPNALACVTADQLAITDDDAYLALVGRSPLNRARVTRRPRVRRT